MIGDLPPSPSGDPQPHLRCYSCKEPLADQDIGGAAEFAFSRFPLCRGCVGADGETEPGHDAAVRDAQGGVWLRDRRPLVRSGGAQRLSLVNGQEVRATAAVDRRPGDSMTDLVPVTPAILVPAQSGVDDAVTAWLKSFPNEGTRRSFAHAMTLWRAYLDRIGRDLADPHPVGSPGYRGPRRVDANAWRDELRDTVSERTGRRLSGKTVDARLIAIRSFYEFLCEEGALEVNPIQHAKLLSRASPRKMVSVERSAWEAAQAAATVRGENLTRQTTLFLRRYARPRRGEAS